MSHQCYYCGQILETKEKLYDHLDIHTKLSDKQAKKKKAKSHSKEIVEGESALSEDEIMEQFNASKSGEPSRMSSRSQYQKYGYVIFQKELIHNMKIHCECGICGHTVDQECIMNDCDCCVNFHVRSGQINF